MQTEAKYNLNKRLAEKSITSILNALGNSKDGLSFKEIERKTALSPTTIAKQIKYLLAEEAINKGLGNKYKITTEGITLLHKLPTEAMIEKVPLSTMPVTFGRNDEKSSMEEISNYNCNFGGTVFIDVNAVIGGDVESVKQYLNNTIGSVVNGLPSSITAGTIVFTFNRGLKNPSSCI